MSDDALTIFSMVTGVLSPIWLVGSVVTAVTSQYVSLLLIFVGIPIVWLYLIYKLSKMQ
jgi:hypothetical protein